MADPIISGSVLAPYAQQAVVKIAKRLSFRWRLATRVRRRVGFSFNRRLYIRWLKHLPPTTFELPVEDRSPELTRQLDDVLSQLPEWRNRHSRDVDAAIIIDATYLELFRLLDPAASAILSEQWAASRSRDTLSAIRSMSSAFGGARLPKEQYISEQRRASQGRRALRLRSLGVDARSLTALLNVVPANDIEVRLGDIRVLHGPLGSGKSEAAERWFLSRLDDFQQDSIGLVPVWLSARDIVGSLESSLGAAVGGRDLLSFRGVAAVIDGLDEVSSSQASHLIGQSQILATQLRRCSILATTRVDGLEGTTEEQQLSIPTMSFDDAARLIQHVAGITHPIGTDSPPHLRDAVRAPFFALAAARELRAQRPIAGRAGLMRAVIDAALEQAKDQVGTSTPELYDLLTTLAVQATNEPGNIDARSWSIPDRRRLTATSFVVLQGERLKFVLPLFEQWFAAHAVMSGAAAVEDAVGNSIVFDRWRWPLAMAVASGPPETIDRILQTLFAWRAGAGAWVLTQASAGILGHSGDQPILDQSSGEVRLGVSLAAWDQSLGPLGPVMFRHDSAGNLCTLGVLIDGRTAVLGWWNGEPRAERSISLPPGSHPFRTPPPHWLVHRATQIADEDTWPWLIFQKTISSRMSKVLSGDGLVPVLEDGPWLRELFYGLARALARQQSLRHPPMNLDNLSTQVTRLLEQIPASSEARLPFGSIIAGRQTLVAFEAWLDSQASSSVHRTYPEPDVVAPTGNTVWDLYSDARLLETTTEVVGAAVEIYHELVAGPFSSLDWASDWMADKAFGAVGQIYRPPDGYAQMAYRLLPLEYVRSEADRSYTSSNGRAIMSFSSQAGFASLSRTAWRDVGQYLDGTPDDRPFWRLYSAASILEVTGDRPATKLAMKWLWSDLEPLGLARGPSPSIR